MQSALITYLVKDYPEAMGLKRSLTAEELMLEVNNSGRFEVSDIKGAVIQSSGEGTAVFDNRTGYTVEIVKIEAYVKALAGTKAGKGDTCDFILAPNAGNSVIVLAELSRLQSQYIRPFTQQKTGSRRPGKRAHVIDQLQSTINRLTMCGTLISDIKSRVALFAYRLTDEDEGGNVISRRTKKAWNRARQRFSADISNKDILTHGFIFEQKQYPNPFIMT